MITQWYLNLEFEWAKDLPELYDITLGAIYYLIGEIFLLPLDIALMPIELIIWFIKRKRSDKE